MKALRNMTILVDCRYKYQSQGCCTPPGGLVKSALPTKLASEVITRIAGLRLKLIKLTSVGIHKSNETQNCHGSFVGTNALPTTNQIPSRLIKSQRTTSEIFNHGAIIIVTPSQ
jgi:hypothetical protein